MTFAKPYAEWKGMFAGNGMLLPRSMTSTPEAFNKAQLNGPGPSAGPFVVTTVDKSAQRIVLTRNPKWWGQRPRLDSITFTVLAPEADIPGPAEQRDRRGRAGLAGRPVARSAHRRHLDPARTGRQLESLHVQRRAGLDPRRPEAAVGDHESH